MSTFSLVNDYGWLSINVNTGEVTATSTDLISGRFPVTIVEDDAGVITNHNTEIAVYGPSGSITLQNNQTPLIRNDDGVQLASSSTFFANQITKSSTSTEWKVIYFYREKYGSVPMDVIVIDDELGTVSQQVQSNTSYNYSYNGAVGVRSDQWKMYFIGVHTTLHNTLSTYDPATDTFVWDAVPGMTMMQGQSAIEIAPISRDIIFYATSGGYGQLCSINTTTNAFTFLTAVGNVARDVPRATSLGLGQDYIYTSLGRTPNVELYQTTYDGLTSTLIASTTDNLGDIKLTQLTGGAVAEFTGVVGYADGDYWLHQNTIVAVTNIDVPPWTNPTPYNIYGSELPEAAGTPYSFNYAQRVAPDGTGQITVNTDGIATNYPITVTTYPFEINNIIQSAPDKVLAGGVYYSGLTEYNVDTNTQFGFFDATTSRTEMVSMPNGDVVFGGYPSQYTHIKPFGVASSTVLGYLGGDTGPTRGHYHQGLCIGIDGLVYSSGVQYRVGDSGTIGWFNPYDFENTKDGFSGETDIRLLEYGLNNCVAVGDKIIVSSYIVSGSLETAALVFVFDTVTKTFTATHSLGTDLKSTGWIVKVSDTDIFGVTALQDVEKTCVVYRMNIVTGAILYKIQYGGVRYQQSEDTFQAHAKPVKLGADGKVYFTSYGIAPNFSLVRVDPSIGGVELLGNITGQDIIELMDNGDIYFGATSGNMYNMSIANLPDVMPPIRVAPSTVHEFPYTDFLAGSGVGVFVGGWSWDSVGGRVIRTAQAGTAIADFSFMPNIIMGQKYRVTMTIDSITGGDGLLSPTILGNDRYNIGAGVYTQDIIASTNYIRVTAGDNEGVAISALTVNALLNDINVQYGYFPNQEFIDVSEWNLEGDGSYTVANNVATVTAGSNYYGITNVSRAEVGATYRITANIRVGTSTDGLIRVYNNYNADAGTVNSNSVTDKVSFQPVTVDIVATTDFISIYLRCSGPGLTNEFKDLVVTKL